MAGHDGEFVINLRRNNVNTPWGFRLQGGKEYNTFLSIQRVFNGSPADGHLHRGDVIVAVDNEDVTHWHQKQAQDFIDTIGLTLALVVRRGGAVSQPPSQAQPVPSFVRKPFGQQQHPQHQQQQYQPPHPPAPPQLSPQMTSKTTLRLQPSPYSPTHQPMNDLENFRPPAAPWSPQSPASPSGSFSTAHQLRTAQPYPKFSPQSPQHGDSYGQGQPAKTYQPVSFGSGQAAYQQQQQPDYGGGRQTYAHDTYQREAVQPAQQPIYDGSNHVAYDRNQYGGGGYESQNEPAYSQERKEEGGEEDEDYQQMTVRDIKQMFNKPDQRGSRAPVSRIKQSGIAWTRPEPEVSIAPVDYGAPTAPHAKPTTGSIRRGPPPSDDLRMSFSPTAPHNYGQPRYASPPGPPAKPKAGVTINKQGGAYAGIVQPAVPTKPAPKPGPKGAPQKKKDFDPNQSAVLKMLQEEEERAKNHPHQKDEEEEEEAPRRQPQQEQRQAQRPRQAQGGGGRGGQRPAMKQQQQQQQQQEQQHGSRLTQLLERDAAQLAPYKDEPRVPHLQDPMPHYQEPYQEPRGGYQEPRAPFYQDQGPPPPQPYQSRGPPRGGQAAARQAAPPPVAAYSSYDYTPSFPQTQYVDGIPTSDF